VSSINSNLDPYRYKTLDQNELNYVKNQQNTGDNYTKLQWVGYGVGGAFLVASSVFLYRGYFAKPTDMAAGKSRSNLIVLPAVAPGNIGALAYLAF
jgi:hypothetical protein